MDTPISRAEHEAFAKLMEAENSKLADEDKRQNKRIEVMEKQIAELFKVTASIDRLATNIENMVKVQEKQGKRLETLENRDGENWRKMIGYIGTAILGAVLAIVFAKIGL